MPRGHANKAAGGWKLKGEKGCPSKPPCSIANVNSNHSTMVKRLIERQIVEKDDVSRITRSNKRLKSQV